MSQIGGYTPSSRVITLNGVSDRLVIPAETSRPQSHIHPTRFQVHSNHQASTVRFTFRHARHPALRGQLSSRLWPGGSFHFLSFLLQNANAISSTFSREHHIPRLPLWLLDSTKMTDHESLVGSYIHLAKEQRASDALHTLKKIASQVKPMMRARGWKVGQLTEFYPDQTNLLGMYIPCFTSHNENSHESQHTRQA